MTTATYQTPAPQETLPTHDQGQNTTAFAERLRQSMAAMRLSFRWLGTRKTLSPEQRSQAAESFGAEGEFLTAGKKLLDTRHPRFRAVNAIRGTALQFLKASSLPFPEPAVRLLRRDDVEGVVARLTALQEELAEAVAELDIDFSQLKASAERRLGSLYDPADYPASLADEFGMSWDFPSVEPPPYLRRLSPALYREECERARARFTEAVQLAEQAFVEELAALVEHLNERLTGEDGRARVFRDSAVTNFDEFFDRFRRLSIGSSAELDELVTRARQVLSGVAPQQLRDSQPLRERITAQLTEVRTSLEGLLMDRPRRAIQRRAR